MTKMVHGAASAHKGEAILPKWWQTIDIWSLGSVFLLAAIGLLLALAASVPLAEKNDLWPFFYVQRQVVFVSVALSVMLLASMLSPTQARRLCVIGFAITFVALVLLPWLGTDFGKGATRWYSLGFSALQPSEFLKPLFIVSAAWLMAATQQIGGPPGRLWSFGICTVLVFILIMQPDFGQAFLVIFGWGVIYFVSGAPWLILIILGGVLIAGGALAYRYSGHFAGRIDGFLNSEVNPTTQLGYASNAIREGGIFGTGLGGGQVKWSLPDAHTDFIIAVAAEEYGLILVLVIIALYANIVVRALRRLMRDRDVFVRLAGVGLVCTFGGQALINMAVAVRLLPAKGMTLPFVSYGGSSLIASGLTLGMLLAFTRTRAQSEISEILGQPLTKR